MRNAWGRGRGCAPTTCGGVLVSAVLYLRTRFCAKSTTSSLYEQTVSAVAVFPFSTKFFGRARKKTINSDVRFRSSCTLTIPRISNNAYRTQVVLPDSRDTS